MKKLIFGILVILANQAFAEDDFVPLDMELGYWEITTQVNLDAILAKVPPAQREMMRQMMTSKVEIPVVKQCITQEVYDNMKDKMMESAKATGNNCSLNVIHSSKSKFSGEVTCSDHNTRVSITTKVINAKRHESRIVSDEGGTQGTNFTTVGEWKSATCPAGI